MQRAGQAKRCPGVGFRLSRLGAFHPVDPAGLGVERVVTRFLPDDQEEDQAAGDAQRKARYVDKGGAGLPAHLTPGGKEIVTQHIGKKWFGKRLCPAFKKGGPQEAQHFAHVLPPGVGGTQPFGPPPEPFVQVALHLFAQVRRTEPFQQAVGPPGRSPGKRRPETGERETGGGVPIGSVLVISAFVLGHLFCVIGRLLFIIAFFSSFFPLSPSVTNASRIPAEVQARLLRSPFLPSPASFHSLLSDFTGLARAALIL